MTRFLIEEAHKLQSLALPASHGFLKVRIDALTAELRADASAQFFFETLADKLSKHPNAPTDVGALTSYKLDSTQAETMLQANYVKPTDKTVAQCTALFNRTLFSTLSAGESLQQALAFAHQMSATERNLFLSRLECVVHQVLAVVKK